MFKDEIKEAAPVVNATVDQLLVWLPSKGRVGADARRACGDVKAFSLKYLAGDTLGPPLALAFQLSREAGLDLTEMNNVRSVAAAHTEVMTIGAVVVRDACIQLALVEMGRIIADMIFVSKIDVAHVRDVVNDAYTPMEDAIADQMDSETYQALIGLHAAIIAHLTETARPLPQMLQFRFAQPWPTLVMAQKLYANGGRADELRRENKVIHPAFALPQGLGLSE